MVKLEILKILSIDLSEKRNTPVVYVVQGDKNSRKIRFNMFQNGVLWNIDNTANVLISYKKPDGHGGMYDVLDNGQSAFEFANDSANSVIITLSEQVLTTVGHVNVVVSFIIGDKILSTFNIILDVSENPGIDVAESEDYFSLSVAINAAIQAAQKLPPPLYLVTIDDSNMADKSYSDIMSALESGYVVQCDYHGILLNFNGMFDYEPMFSGINSLTSYVVIVRTNRQTIIHKYSLAKTTDIPNKVSELENDQGYATEEYVDNAVSNIPSGGGSYRLPIATPDTLGGVQPVGKTDGMTQNVGVDELGGLWTAPGSGINVNSAIPGQTIVVKEVDENGKPTQWEAADFPICGKTLVDFKLTEPVSEISIPLDDDMLQALQDAMFICLEIRPKGDETATDTTGFGKATCLLCGRPVFNDFEFIPSAETSDYPVLPYFMAQLAKFNMSEPYMLMNKITAVSSGMKVSQGYLYMPLINPKSHVLQLTGELPFGTNTHIQLYVH